jgi:SAM-dependent methyltransferase
MGHKFDPKKAELLDSDKRRSIFPPEPLMELVAKQNIDRDIAFDIGAGTGYFTIPLAGMFKKVYAVDLSVEMAKLLKKRLDEREIKNVGIIVSEKPPKIDFHANLVLFSNVIHELDDPMEYIKWCEGADCIVIADWKIEEGVKPIELIGPPLNERIPPEKLVDMLKGIGASEGFEVKVMNHTYPYHYVVIARKVEP